MGLVIDFSQPFCVCWSSLALCLASWCLFLNVSHLFLCVLLAFHILTFLSYLRSTFWSFYLIYVLRLDLFYLTYVLRPDLSILFAFYVLIFSSYLRSTSWSFLSYSRSTSWSFYLIYVLRPDLSILFTFYVLPDLTDAKFCR